jgi:hypothetical protein
MSVVGLVNNRNQSKKKKTTYNEIMQVFKDVARMAVTTGNEDSVFGTAIQLMHCVKTGGEVLDGELSDVISTFRNTFVSTDTNKVSFSLQNQHSELLPAPSKPPSKPSGRHVESRMVSKYEMGKVAAIKGNSKSTPKCSFCKAKNCRVSSCSVKAGWGIVVEDGTKHGRPNGIAHLMTQLSNIMRENNMHLVSIWPSKEFPNLQVGVPRFAKHMVIHGLHQYCTPNCPKMIVGAVQFIEEGGLALDGFEYVPMTNDEMVKAIHGTFKASSRFVFVSETLQRTMINISNMPEGNQVSNRSDGLQLNEKNSDDEDDVVLASLVIPTVPTVGKRQKRSV